MSCGRIRTGVLKYAAYLQIALLLASSLLLTNCVVGPRYKRPAVKTPPEFKELGPSGANGWKTAQPREEAIRGEWWKTFDNPQLNELENKTAASNQNIAAASANFLAARAIVREARSRFFPTLAANPSIRSIRPSPAQFGGLRTSSASVAIFGVRSFSDFELPFDASWEPDFWGRIRSGVRASAFAAQVSAADLENVRLTEQGELAADYYELCGQDALKQVFDSTVSAYQNALDLTQTLYKAGLTTDEAVAQAEAQLKAAQAQDTNLAILRAQYEHAIAVLIGEPPSSFSLPTCSLPLRPPPIPTGIPSELLERRPDIAAAERAVAQANAQIGVAKAAYYPDIVLSATVGFGNSSITDWFSWPSRFWSVGPSAAQTIFDAGLRKATVEQYRATYDQTVATYRQTVLIAFQQVEDNLAALRILSQDVEQQDAAVAAADRSLQEATVRYKAGLDPYLNVINAQSVLLNDQQLAVDFRVQQMVASVQLIKALGGGWQVSQLPNPGR